MRLAALSLIALLTGCAAETAPSVTSAPADVSPSPTAEDRISKANFDRVQVGMSLAQVEGILGPGELVSETEMMGEKIQSYNWIGFGKGITLTFQGGKLGTKSQFGLK